MHTHPSSRREWLADPLSLASGTVSRLLLAAGLLALLWSGVAWALAV